MISRFVLLSYASSNLEGSLKRVALDMGAIKEALNNNLGFHFWVSDFLFSVANYVLFLR